MSRWIGIAVCVCALAAMAQETPMATAIAWTPLWRADAPITIPIGDTHARQTIEIPKLTPPDGHALCLRFQARMQFATPAGWNNYLGLEWNNAAIGAKTARNQARVLNRHDPFSSKHPNYPLVPWFAVRDGVPCIEVFFGPPNHELDASVISDRQEGYWYVIDISDLSASEAGNKLTVVNTALKRYWNNALPADAALIVEDFAVGAVPAETINEMHAARLIKREPLLDPNRPENGVKLYLRNGAGLQMTIDNDVYFVESAFSFPRDGGMGFNRLACLPEAEGEPGWRPDVSSGPDGLGVRAEGSLYRLDRRIVRAEPRLEIADTITNKTDQVLGIAVKHRIITPDYAQRTYLGGLETAVLGAGASAENPTVFVAQAQSGLGAVAEDNAMRLQMGWRVDENAAEFGTERLGLAPNESYTLRLTLYAGGADYFAFINQLRRDWNVNFTVEGAFDFFDTARVGTPEGREQAKQLLGRKKMKLFGLTPWFEYYNGWTVSRDEYKQRMTQARAFVKSVDPEAKCLACIETNLVPVDLAFFKDTIPKEGWPIGRDVGGKYGQKATAAMTACIDASPWRDSCLRDADGSVLLDCWYVQYYTSKPALNLMVYPTLENHRHQNMLEQIAWLLDDVGLDGVYIDQFSLAWGDDFTRYSKERWDGRTIALDADGRVKSTMTDLGLVSSAARRAWVESVLQRGKTVVCNTNPATSELQSLPAFRFMETQGYDPLAGDGPPFMDRMPKGQLGSPLGLGHSFPGTAGADFFMRTVIAHLRCGLLYYYYSTEFPAADSPEGRIGGEFGPVNHMFPFTPIELHEGWVLGKERLITCISGTFPWPHDREPRILQFDNRGRERLADATVTRADGRCEIKIKLRDWWEIAVVE